MSKTLRQLTFCLLAATLTALAAAPAAEASFLSYSQSATGETKADACSKARQEILDNCDGHGPITYSNAFCTPVFGPGGAVIDQICFCTATATYCVIFNPNPNPPFLN